jgi:hypothetical protein
VLGIEGLSPDDINQFLDLADGYVELNRQADKKRSTLRGRTIINCFFESSTRTRTSFELAGQRLGGDVINMSVPTSSMVKGETLIDKPDALIMHPGPMNRGVEIGSEIRRPRPQPDPLAGRDRRHRAHGLSRDPDPRSRQRSDRTVNPLLIRRAASDPAIIPAFDWDERHAISRCRTTTRYWAPRPNLFARRTRYYLRV